MLTQLVSNVHFVHLEVVESSKVGIDRLVDLAEAQQRKQHQDSSELRSSNSSLLALSKSQNDRLCELQSLQSSLSEKMDRMMQMLSSPGSQVSSSDADEPNSKVVLPSIRGTSPSQHNGSDIPKNDLLPYPAKLIAIPSETVGVPEDVVDGDVERVIGLLEDFHLLIDQQFDSLIAEYIHLVELWRIASLRGALLGIIEQGSTAPRIVSNVALQPNLSSLAAYVLSLRRRAEAEGVVDSLEEADNLLGIGSLQLSQFEILASSATPDKKDEKLPLLQSARVSSKESLIRMNEWLFAVMDSIPYLSDWHRGMTGSLIAVSRRSLPGPEVYVGVDSALPRKETIGSLMRRDEWERLTVKTWLLDGTNLDAPRAYAASSFTNSRESDMTVLASHSGVSIDEEGGDPIRKEALLLKQPTADIRTLRRFLEFDAIEEYELPPEAASTDQIKRARQALQDYVEEESALSG